MHTKQDSSIDNTFTFVSLTSRNFILFLFSWCPYILPFLCASFFISPNGQSRQMRQPGAETNSSGSAGNERTPVVVDHWGFCCSLTVPGTLTETPILCLCAPLLVNRHSVICWQKGEVLHTQGLFSLNATSKPGWKHNYYSC